MSVGKSITVNDIFNTWKLDLRENHNVRYLYKNRKEHIENLVTYLINTGVSLDDAKDLRNKVLLELTTAEGRKGKGRYKGWKENVLDDFDMIVSGMYVEIPTSPPQQHETINEMLEDEYIKEWAVKIFGDNEFAIRESQTIGTLLNSIAITEVYYN